jgi:hypothetical protein
MKKVENNYIIRHNKTSVRIYGLRFFKEHNSIDS